MCKAHVLQPDGNYEKVDRRGKAALIAQDYFVEEAKEKAKKKTGQPMRPMTGYLFQEEPVPDVED